MSASSCVVCLAAEEADESNLRALVRWQAVHLDKARAELLPVQVALGQARDRIRELEDIVSRQQRVILKANGRRKTA